MSIEQENIDDSRLAQAVARAAPADPPAPAFDAIWAQATAEHGRSRRRYMRFATAAMLLAVLVVALNFDTQSEDELRFIYAADLLDSTSWSAPSDALLPNHQFDIYQEFPGFIESTRPVEGALL